MQRNAEQQRVNMLSSPHCYCTCNCFISKHW